MSELDILVCNQNIISYQSRLSKCNEEACRRAFDIIISNEKQTLRRLTNASKMAHGRSEGYKAHTFQFMNKTRNTGELGTEISKRSRSDTDNDKTPSHRTFVAVNGRVMLPAAIRDAHFFGRPRRPTKR